MKKIFLKLKNEDGFTLLEMSIVIMIVAALLMVIIPNVGNVNEKTNDTTQSAAINTVETQMILYKLDHPEDTTSGEVLLDKLVKDKYITIGQRTAYENK